MPVHDWSLVEAGVFHDFHVGWLPALRSALNAGVLPEGYYAMTEQHAGRSIADILTLHESPGHSVPLPALPDTGGTAVAEAPPRVRIQRTIEAAALTRRRSLAIRHVSGHRLIALAEIVSPANKDRSMHVDEFVAKVVAALDHGVHVLVVDLFPPGSHDAHGLHERILQRLEQSDEAYELPADEPLTLASYAAGPTIEAYVEHLAIGSDLPAMPLFLRHDRYVDVPLEATYAAAYHGLPAYWRAVLDARK